MPVELHCGLCPTPTPIETTSRHAHVAAVDHLLDQHRVALLADPDATERAITVRSPSPTPRRHTPVAA